MTNKNTDFNNISKRSHKYWEQRATTYTKVNIEELNNSSKLAWYDYLSDKFFKTFKNIDSNNLKALDIGTGPAFIAIILSLLKLHVSAVDFSHEMLEEAKNNIKNMNLTLENINLQQMDAHKLHFEDNSFDIIISRNLTWNLEDPVKAYKEWFRVLKKGGLLLIFDANWYAYLYNENLKTAYEKDRENVKQKGFDDQCIGDNFDECEDIARHIAQSHLKRPAWDLKVLNKIGFTNCNYDIDIWQKLWDEEKKINFASTPLFEISARK